MGRVSGWIAAASLAAAIGGGCGTTPPGADDASTRDAGRDGGSVPPDGTAPDASDPCAGRTLCATAGTSCDGDVLVTCALDGDGCMVEAREDCGLSDEVCGDPTGVWECVSPCALLPDEDRCDAESRACDGETLDVCAMNVDGCLVRTRTACDAMPGGVCDDSGTTPDCALPADPCAAIPAADRCATAGTSCDGETLVTCAPNAFGCLVTTRTDCTERGGGLCDEAAATPACTFTGDPCTGVTECTTPAEATCDGPSLVTCAPDAFGCMVETRTDCTTATFGFCGADPAGPDACATAATDPCMGMTLCPTESRACGDRTSITTCARNAFGCLVETTTACTGGEVCDASGGVPICVDPCSLVTVCASATSCDGDTLVACAPDGDGCLVESSRTPCVDTCDAPASGPASCVDTICPGSAPAVLDCASGTWSGTTTGGTDVFDAYPGCTSADYSGEIERAVRFRHAGSERVEVTVTSSATATGDFDLFVMDGGDGTTACDASTTCLDGSRNGGGAETVTFVADPGSLQYLVYDHWSGSAPTTDYTLTIACTPIVCGDGMRQTSEACDDGDTDAGDGCSPTCTVEPGYTCTGTPSTCALDCGNGSIQSPEECDDGDRDAMDGCSSTCTVEAGYRCYGAPSTCALIPPNATCAGATPITGTGTLTGEDLRLGGALPTGAGCARGTATTALYYSVTIPANTRVDVSASSSADLVLRALDACGGACTANVDSGNPERTSLANTTGAPVTRIVVVSPYGSSSGTADVSFTYVSLAPNASCGGATAITADTTITGESLAGGGAVPTGTGCSAGSGTAALSDSVTVPAFTRARVVVTPTGFDPVVRAQSACDATSCLAAVDAGGSGGAETYDVSNATASPITRIVSVSSYNATLGTYSIAVTYTAAACGNGVVDGGETCDDGGTAPSDGCSDTCQIESGWTCSGAPSTCVTLLPNATCAGATAVTANASFTGQDLARGGPRPMGTGCGTSSGNNALYYAVTLGAGQTVQVQTTPAIDVVLLTQDACGAGSCTFRTDSSPERATLTNSTAAPVTQIVAVHNYFATTLGSFDIAFTYQTCGNGMIEGTEACDDGDAMGTDGCSATCTVETGYLCTGAPSNCRLPYTASTIAAACVTTGTFTSLTRSSTTSDDATTPITALPFSLPFFAETVTHFSTSTNGFVQLYPSSSGSAIADFSNDAIPNTSTPNRIVAAFWDDIYLGAAFDIRTQTTGSAGSQVFVIEWVDALAGSGGAPLTFQVHLHEATGNVELHYCSVGAGTRASGDSATIGLENATGTLGTQTSYNTAGAVATGTAFRYTPNP